MNARWLRLALQNLDAEAEYIANDSPRASARTVGAIREAVKLLADCPSMGRPGRVPGTRELVAAGTPYIIPYRVRGNHIHISVCFTLRVSGPRISTTKNNQEEKFGTGERNFSLIRSRFPQAQ